MCSSDLTAEAVEAKVRREAGTRLETGTAVPTAETESMRAATAASQETGSKAGKDHTALTEATEARAKTDSPPTSPEVILGTGIEITLEAETLGETIMKNPGAATIPGAVLETGEASPVLSLRTEDTTRGRPRTGATASLPADPDLFLERAKVATCRASRTGRPRVREARASLDPPPKREGKGTSLPRLDKPMAA